MLRHCKFLTSGRFWRLVHIFTAVFVLSYIAFDVLDLDPSDFPLKRAPRQRVVVVTEMPKGTELASLLEGHLLRMEPLLLDPSFKESIRLHHKDMLRTFSFGVDRIYVHRITHPLSSALESSPAS